MTRRQRVKKIWAPEVINYTMHLFFSVDDNGNRRYTNKHISELVTRKFQEKYKDSKEFISLKRFGPKTVAKLSEEKDELIGESWDTLFRKNIDNRHNKSKQEIITLMESITAAGEIRNLDDTMYKAATVSMIKGWDYILKGEIDTVRDAQWMVEQGFKQIMILSEKGMTPGDKEKEKSFSAIQKRLSKDFEAKTREINEAPRIESSENKKEKIEQESIITRKDKGIKLRKAQEKRKSGRPKKEKKFDVDDILNGLINK